MFSSRGSARDPGGRRGAPPFMANRSDAAQHPQPARGRCAGSGGSNGHRRLPTSPEAAPTPKTGPRAKPRVPLCPRLRSGWLPGAAQPRDAAGPAPEAAAAGAESGRSLPLRAPSPQLRPGRAGRRESPADRDEVPALHGGVAGRAAPPAGGRAEPPQAEPRHGGGGGGRRRPQPLFAARGGARCPRGRRRRRPPPHAAVGGAARSSRPSGGCCRASAAGGGRGSGSGWEPDAGPQRRPRQPIPATRAEQAAPRSARGRRQQRGGAATCGG